MLKYVTLYVVIIVALNFILDLIFRGKLNTNYYKGSKNKKRLLKKQKEYLKKQQNKEKRRK